MLRDCVGLRCANPTYATHRRDCQFRFWRFHAAQCAALIAPYIPVIHAKTACQRRVAQSARRLLRRITLR